MKFKFPDPVVRVTMLHSTFTPHTVKVLVIMVMKESRAYFMRAQNSWTLMKIPNKNCHAERNQGTTEIQAQGSDKENGIIYVNDAFVKMFGYENENQVHEMFTRHGILGIIIRNVCI